MKNNIVTKIEPQVRSVDRFSVFIDDEFAFGISDFDLYNLKIRVGDIIDENRLLEIENIINIDKCKNYAVSLVSRKMYTKKEITDKMIQKGFSSTAISEVISLLEEYAYIDDNVYAKLYVREYLKKYGSKKLSYNLKLKGIPDDIINDVLMDFDNKKELYNLIDKKAKGNLNDPKECARIVRQFLSKGFEYEDIKSCLDSLKIRREDFDV